MYFPSSLCPLAVVVSDFHLWTQPERQCEMFLWEHGARRNLIAQGWNWLVSVRKNVQLATQLLREFRRRTDSLISLGDHYCHLVTENALGQPRARLSALAVRDILTGDAWNDVTFLSANSNISLGYIKISGRLPKASS